MKTTYDKWKKYVESYNDNTSKKVHLISATHVVKKLLDEDSETILDLIDKWKAKSNSNDAKALISWLKIMIEEQK